MQGCTFGLRRDSCFPLCSNMKLRVRINKQTRRVELEGPNPTLTQLCTWVREDLLPSAGLG